ncbi:hypothetical protein Ahy_B05g076089 [Arachis hypogaea]|uniref:Uncharacterized protein n=1 Tax=Arachis hypogaea TaxID=3818 RepID=A0A444Z2X7_ARAHY|nr:hypothetical protein Ahy_B05g076089 [Arachis hypogaea]
MDAFSGNKHLTVANGHASASIMKKRYENTLVIELDIAAREKFKLIEHGLKRLWERLSRSKIQEASEELGEVIPDSMEEEDVVSSDGSHETDSARQNASVLSYA